MKQDDDEKKILSLLTLGLAAFGLNQANAQDSYPVVGRNYDAAIGLNLGADMGIGYKQFVGRAIALEFQGAYNIPDHGVMFSTVIQFHIPIAENATFYIGGGFNIGALYLNNHYEYNREFDYEGRNRFAFGLDPTIGFEWKLRNAPVVLALDYKPNINVTKHTENQWELAAFKVRWTF